MKNNLIEEDIVRIKKLINNVLKERFELIKDENIISEQIFPLLTKYLGKGIVTKLETSMGDDVVKNLERLFVKGEVNFTKNSLGKIVVKSASGTEVEMRTISAALDAVSKGTMKVDDVVKLLPRKLKDGTEFRSIFDTQLRNAKPKPKPKPNTNTTSGSSTGGNTGKQSFGPKKNKSLLDPKNTIMDPAKTEQNLSTLRKEYPGFKLFENQVDLVPGFSSEARNYVKLNFINGEGDVINQLIEARTKLISARFGPLSVLVEKILRKPVKSALWLCAALFALYLVKQSLTGIKIMDDRTTKGMKWLDQNLPGGETNNSNGGSDGAKKGDLD